MIFKILKKFTVISLSFLIPFELIAGVTISGGKITGGTINGMTVVEGSNKDNVDNGNDDANKPMMMAMMIVILVMIVELLVSLIQVVKQNFHHLVFTKLLKKL